MKLDKELTVKLEKFKRDRRAYISCLLLFSAFLLTLPAELICNSKPIMMSVDGKWYFPIFVTYSEKDFFGDSNSEPEYKSSYFRSQLKGGGEPFQVSEKNSVKEKEFSQESDSFSMSLDDFEEEETPDENPAFILTLDDFEEFQADTPTVNSDNPLALALEDFDEDLPLQREIPTAATAPPSRKAKNVWTLWPPVRYDYKYISTESQSGRDVLAAPFKTRSKVDGREIPSSWLDGHYLGTDDRGRDVLARLIYGFRISMLFGISLALTGTMVGCLLGGVQGFFGGWIDLVGQRLTEIWGSMPRLFILIILSSFLQPSVLILFLILNLTAWMGIAAYIRAEFLKSRNLEYVKAAKAMGVSNFEIMIRHLLPNSLTPVVTFFPFEVTAGILALVSLDFLNLGVPSPAPSIGELLAQGKNNLHATWIMLPTFIALTSALTLLTFVGEGIRNAFDPKRVG